MSDEEKYELEASAIKKIKTMIGEHTAVGESGKPGGGVEERGVRGQKR